MVREDYTLDWDLAQAQPWEDDGAGHDQHQPERCGAHDRLTKRLASRLVVLDEEEDL